MKKRALSLLMSFVLLVSLLPATTRAAETDPLPFTSAMGTLVGVTEDGYAYDSDWDGVADATADLYTLSVPLGTQGDVLTFDSPRIAYGYDASGNYLSSCAADASAGYAGGGQVGESTAQVRLSEASALPELVVVQTPYDGSWQSETLYAVAYEYTHTFAVTVNGTEINAITASANAYEYYDWFAEQSVTVMLFTVTLPAGTTEVELTSSENVLLYNYDGSGNYLAGWYDGDAMYTGGTSATVTVDSNGDGAADFIQVQTPYDESWSSTLLYAVTFAVEAGESGGDGETGAVPENSAVDTLLKNIAAANTENSGEWWIMDMGAYTALALDDAATSESAKQVYINAAIASLGTDDVSDTTCAKAILALTAIGADARQLYGVNSNDPLDAIALLNAATQSVSAWSAPYTLAAYNQGEYEGVEEYASALVAALLEAQQEDGSWDEWGTIDTTANVLAGLSFYAGDEAVDAAIARGVSYLATQLQPGGAYDGGYGANANSTAMVIIGLAAVGVDPGSDARFVREGASVLDGLLSFALADGSGFGYLDDGAYNASATEQAFRALIAARGVMTTGEAFNVYDFSANEVSPARAVGSEASELPDAPDEDEGDGIRVKLSIKADGRYWLKNATVTLEDGATVCHALLAAIEDSGIEQDGAERGYVRSMSRNGVTLAEFDEGENSGWLYKVNGALPNVGLTDYVLEDGDRIVWYYTEDWTRDPSAGKHKDEAVTPVEPSETVEPTVLPFADVSEDAWYRDAVRFVWEQGLMTGVSDDSFLPDGTATRAQVVTILHRLAGSPVVNYPMLYTDVSEEAWYAEAVRWATSEGIVTGYSEALFSPDDAVTREQLAAMLYRFVQKQGGGFTGAWYFLLRFDDVSEIGAWANESMHWCVMRGILNGTGEKTLSPKETATRAQLAAILQRFDSLPADDENTPAAQSAYDAAAAYLANTVSAPTVGSIGGEWTVLALTRGGAMVDAEAYLASLEAALSENDGILSERKYTEFSRVILALTSLGIDARSVAGYDLTLPLGDFEKTTAQGVNGASFALLALDGGDYPMPEGGATRQMYVDAILAAQRADGGWSLREGGDADADLTAMALQALAKYRKQSAVADAIERALERLSTMQSADGGFASDGVANAESCAQVLLALCELGIGADDARFVKHGCSVLDALLSYQTVGGGFRHTADGDANLMATEQAACALASLVRVQRGGTSFYAMNETAVAKAA